MLAGFLPGAIISGVQLAVSAANTGGAWDNAKKYIESGAMTDDEGRRVKKGSDIHKAAVVGDTVGDPLKDTSGPALNILMKLMAIISLVFGSKFAAMHPVQWNLSWFLYKFIQQNIFFQKYKESFSDFQSSWKKVLILL